jgi:hypothetical protein
MTATSATLLRPVLTILALGVMAAVVPAAAQNLVVNSRFDTSLAGWTYDRGVGEATWSSLDVGAQPGSGSMRYTTSQASPAGEFAFFQCLPATGGAVYRAIADFLIPSGQSRTGDIALIAVFYDSADCTTLGTTGVNFGQVVTPGSWQHVGGQMLAPPSTRSVRLYPSLFKNEAGGSLVAHVDNLVFGVAGTVPDCFPDEGTLCLQGGRFRVTASWATSDGATGPGKPVPLTAETGYFWFFSAANVEVLVKAIDACAPPFDRYWVFAAGLTNVFVRLEVTDTVTGAQRVYENPQGRDFMPVLDTGAFATCP